VNAIVDNIMKAKETQLDYEYHNQLAKIQIEQHKLKAEAELEFRKEIGLHHVERDAAVLRDALLKASVELAFAVEMDHNNFVIDQAKLKVKNTRIMYNDVRKKIFKICLKHGVESEHSTRS